VFDESTGWAEQTAGAPFFVHSRWPGPTAIEFLPSLPPGRFRIRARLRHDEGGEKSTVALYANGRSWRSAAGQHLACTWIDFADYGTLATGPLHPGQRTNSIAYRHMVCLTGPPPGEPRTESGPQPGMEDVGQAPYMSAAAGGVPALVRTVELEVGGGPSDGRWEQHRYEPLPVARADQFVARCLAQFPPIGPAPGPGSVGLVIYNGRVSVEELRIIPMPGQR